MTTATAAFREALSQVMTRGTLVRVRGQLTRELRNQTVTISRPLERTIVTPWRHNSIFATVAECVWVLAGRDDLGYLSAYLPRAADFSDDGGVTWRGAYGPRLLAWAEHDQIRAIVDLLQRDPTSRRAVVSLFDPARDHVESRDIPCSNWLHFTVRNDRLHLAVVMRSADLFWGFSGINVFEWSVLQEWVAYWLGVDVGELVFFLSSAHVYERHFGRAHRLLAAAEPPALSGERARFRTPMSELRRTLSTWFELEQSARAESLSDEALASVADPQLRDFLAMVNAHWVGIRLGSAAGLAALDRVSDQALARAGRDYFAWSSGSAEAEPANASPPEWASVRRAIVNLHRAKDLMYGDSWKRRGEQMSVLANVARKVDRIERTTVTGEVPIESTSDTVADLYIYAIKYEAYLSDSADRPLPGPLASWSDGPGGFEVLIDEHGAPPSPRTRAELVAAIGTVFGAIEQSVAEQAPPSRRVLFAQQLADAAGELLLRLAEDNDAVLPSLLAQVG